MQLKNPGQVDRFDGVNCFMEVMADALPLGKVFLNFCQYDKNSQKGNRIVKSVAIYLDVGRATVIAHQILSGEAAKLSEKSRQTAADAKSKYPEPILRVMGGSRASEVHRPDNKDESRQLHIVPGNAKPWIILAEKGPGRSDSRGLIVPEYTTGRGADAVIRIPMTDENFLRFAMDLKALFDLWVYEKFGRLNQFDPAYLAGWDPKTGVKRSLELCSFTQDVEIVEGETPDFDMELSMTLSIQSLPIDKVCMDFSSNTDKSFLRIYFNVRNAELFAQDILSGRIPSLGVRARKNNEWKTPLYTLLSGSKKKGKIESRQFKLLPEADGWILTATCGPGHLSQTGLVVPEYTDETAVKCFRLRISNESLKQLALDLQGLANLWRLKKFGPVIGPRMDEERQKTEDEIAKKRKT